MKHVIAEINIQNLESNKTILVTDNMSAITKTDSNRNNAIDNSLLTDSIIDSPDNALSTNVNETSDFQNVPCTSSADNTDGSRSSPVDSLGKG